MNVAVITNDLDYRTTKLETALKKLKANPIVVMPKKTLVQITKNQIKILDLEGKRIYADLALNWILEPSGLGLELLEVFANTGVHIINKSKAWQLAKSKPLTSLHLACKNINQPDVCFSHGYPATVDDFMQKNSFQKISKPWYGGGGSGIKKVNDKTKLAPPIYLQEFIDNPRRDIRVIVIGNQAIGAMYRIAKKGHWKTNAAAGHSTVAPCELTPKLASLAISATQAIGLDICGVDIIESDSGYKILELNGKPGFHFFEKATSIDVAHKIASFLITQASKSSHVQTSANP